jgi:hypothetical protein
LLAIVVLDLSIVLDLSVDLDLITVLDLYVALDLAELFLFIGAMFNIKSSAL